LRGKSREKGNDRCQQITALQLIDGHLPDDVRVPFREMAGSEEGLGANVVAVGVRIEELVGKGKGVLQVGIEGEVKENGEGQENQQIAQRIGGMILRRKRGLSTD
jgi:hypothetical protein